MDLGAGELYFVREIDPKTKKYTSFVKIGLVHEKEGRDSINRLSEHQTGNPRTLDLPKENYFRSPAINRVEAMMHKVFAPNRVSGEWFEFESERQVIAAIKKAQALATEVNSQIPTFTKASKLGQAQDNGKVILATPNTENLIQRIAIARAKKSILSEIAKDVSSKLKSALDTGFDVEGAAEEVRVNRKGKFNLALLKSEDLRTYKKYLVVTETLSGRFVITKILLGLKDLDDDFQSVVRELSSTVQKAKNKDYRILNEVQLELTNETAVAEWDEEFALAELKLACGKNRSIKGVCTWKREIVEKVSFDEKTFKLENPVKYEQYLEEPTTTTYVKVSKRKV
jgi:hypothetical protein